MNPKLTAKNLLNYIRTTKDKPKFRSDDPTSCPIACYLKFLGNKDVYVDAAKISYVNRKGQDATYLDLDSSWPRWIVKFVRMYDNAKPKHRLRTACKVLEQVVMKQESIS